MNSLRRQFLQLTMGAAIAPMLSTIAPAQTYPARPVRVIVPYAAGGPSDILARIIAQKLSEHLGKLFYVENVGGAGGISVWAREQKPHPTLHHPCCSAEYCRQPGHVRHRTVRSLQGFRPCNDRHLFTHRTHGASVTGASRPSMISLHLIKSSPSKFSFASPGTGTPPHLIGEHFRMLWPRPCALPFNSAGQAVGSSLAGHTPCVHFVTTGGTAD